jgi:hypothetical protein
MPVYNFNSQNQALYTLDSIADSRSDIEQAFSPLALYNHEKPDIAYAERMASELINLSGAWVIVFTKELKSDPEETEVWDEDPDPIYRNGKEIKAYMKPDNIAFELTRWGVDNPLKLNIVFHRPSLIDMFGEKLVSPGDVIRVPYNAARSMLSPDRGSYDFRVLNAFDSGNFMYRWLYYTANSQLLTGDKAVRVRNN